MNLKMKLNKLEDRLKWLISILNSSSTVFDSFFNGLNWRKLSLEYSFFQLFLSLLLLKISVSSSNILQNGLFIYKQDFFSYSVGFDAVSIFFIILTSLIYIICILLNWNLKYKVKEFLLCLFIINVLIINVFLILDLFLFYVYFESILIPMFLLIGIWGSRERKIQAAYKFFLYTLFGPYLCY